MAHPPLRTCVQLPTAPASQKAVSARKGCVLTSFSGGFLHGSPHQPARQGVGGGARCRAAHTHRRGRHPGRRGHARRQLHVREERARRQAEEGHHRRAREPQGHRRRRGLRPLHQDDLHPARHQRLRLGEHRQGHRARHAAVGRQEAQPAADRYRVLARHRHDHQVGQHRHQQAVEAAGRDEDQGLPGRRQDDQDRAGLRRLLGSDAGERQRRAEAAPADHREEQRAQRQLPCLHPEVDGQGHLVPALGHPRRRPLHRLRARQERLAAALHARLAGAQPRHLQRRRARLHDLRAHAGQQHHELRRDHHPERRQGRAQGPGADHRQDRALPADRQADRGLRRHAAPGLSRSRGVQGAGHVSPRGLPCATDRPYGDRPCA
ncbi:hypothetical protein SGPA1_30261 [Streptomyces misionensis JCM 4497]